MIYRAGPCSRMLPWSADPRRAMPLPPGCACTSDRIRSVENPLLEFESLPAFGRIEAKHARTALATVLAENRRRLAELTAQPAPTFVSLVVPVEELSHR